MSTPNLLNPLPDSIPHPESPEGINLIEGKITPAEQHLADELRTLIARVDQIGVEADIERDGTHKINRRVTHPEVTGDEMRALTAQMAEIRGRLRPMQEQRRELARQETIIPMVREASPTGVMGAWEADLGQARAYRGNMAKPPGVSRVYHSAGFMPDITTAGLVSLGPDVTDAMFPRGTWEEKGALVFKSGARHPIAAANELTTQTFPGQSIIVDFVRAPGRDSVHLQLARRMPWSDKLFRISLETVRQSLNSSATDLVSSQAEGAPAAQSRIEYAATQYSMERTSRFHKATIDQLRDEPQANGILGEELRNFLHEDMSIQILRGTGANNQSFGLTTSHWSNVQHHDWDVASARLGSSVQPNNTELKNFIYEVTSAAETSIGKQGKARANAGSASWEVRQWLMSLVDDESRAIMVHPADPFIPMIRGIPIFPSDEYEDPADNVPAMVLADWSYCQLYTWGDVEMAIEKVNDDALRFQRTMIAAFWNRFVCKRGQAVSVIDYNSI